MNRNLFLMEMKRNGASTIAWTIVITALVSGTMLIYPTFAENQSKVLGVITLVPKAALQFKGFSNIGALFSVLGFYAANNVVYMMLLGSIFSVVISSNILLKEEVHRTAEYLMTRPFTRTEIFFSKILVVLIYVVILNIITSLAGLITMKLVQSASFSIQAFGVLSLYTLLLNLLFASAGLFLSTLVKRPRPVAIFSIGMVMILYFLNTIARITESVSKIGYLSPFHYVNMDVMQAGYSLGFWNTMFFVVLTLLLGSLSYRLYLKRDIFV